MSHFKTGPSGSKFIQLGWYDLFFFRFFCSILPFSIVWKRRVICQQHKSFKIIIIILWVGEKLNEINMLLWLELPPQQWQITSDPCTPQVHNTMSYQQTDNWIELWVSEWLSLLAIFWQRTTGSISRIEQKLSNSSSNQRARNWNSVGRLGIQQNVTKGVFSPAKPNDHRYVYPVWSTVKSLI